ncbi:MAG: ABC transporter permease subunit [Bacillota bacterium]|nr:ABC transporter permease subunit [Bacillota bacterium]
MNIFLKELKSHGKSLIIWCIAMFFMIVSSIGKFTAYAETGRSMSELLSQIPKPIKAVLGMGDFDLTKVSGFYGMLYLYLLLLATIHAALLGADIISKEERDKTAEFLLVKPVSRSKIVTSKLFASLFNIAAVNIVTLFFSILLMAKYSGGEDITREIYVLMLGMFILQTLFLSLGTASAAVTKNPGAASSSVTAILLASFIISSLINMNGRLERLKYITPFEYFRAEKLLSVGFEPVFLFLSFVIITSLLIVTYASYKKRDLKV